MAERIDGDDIKAAIAAQLRCASGQIGDDDNLIELGLNSMSMMALAGRWRSRGVDITFAQLAADPTVAEWRRLLSAVEPTPSAQPPAVDAGDDAPFALAPMQHAYWVGRSDEQQLGGVAAHLYVEFDGGEVDPARLRRAVSELVATHPMLHTRFLPDGTQQTQPTTAGSQPPVLTVVDLRGRRPEQVESALAELRDRKTHQRLRIEDGQVFDVTLTRYDDHRSRLHLDVDMLAADAMSYRVLAADLADLYRGATVRRPDYSYRRYRTEHPTETAARDRDRDWWHRRLPDLPGPPRLPLPPDRQRAVGPRTARRAHWLPPAARARLVGAAHARGVTPAMAVAAIFADTVGGWAAQQRFLLNIPLFHRQPVHTDIDRVVGDFTSSVLLEVDVTEDMSVADRARDIQRRMYQSAAHAAYSGLDVLRDLGRHRGEPVLAPIVFTSALDLGELFADGVVEAFGEPVWIVSQGPQVLLDAQVTELRGGLLLNWDVRESAFPPGLIDAAFARLADAVDRIADADTGWDAAAAVRLPAEQARIRARVNATDGGPVGDRCLHQGFFENATANPDAPALVWGVGERAGKWSYADLAGRALAVAGALAAAGIGPGDTVAVRLPRGRDQVLAVLGVLAAGATYLPIGADQPTARAETILRAAGAAAVVTAESADTAVPFRCLGIDTLRSHPAPLAEPVVAGGDRIGYVIFTSGSTGLPKGVAVPHRAAMNTIDALNEWFGVGPADSALGLSALEFDLSVYDMFGMFTAGGTLVVVDSVDAERRAAAWVELLRRHRVSMLNCVPSALEMILDHAGDELGDSLRAVLLGGDWVATDLAVRLAAQAPGCRFAGLGGATETSIHSTICEVAGSAPRWPTVPFGTPLRNVRCRVVSPAGRDCPDWVAGELWIGGSGVAAGYVDDPQRTAQRFVEYDGVRWYKTGDTARYWSDGTIEFLGRADNQVQLHGHRIELGEVEHALRTVPGVRQAVAVPAGNRGRMLAAAITGDPGRLVDTGAVVTAVAELVPSYLVPARIVVLDALPLTPNGKLDRRAVTALVEPDVAPDDDEDGAAGTVLEAALGHIVAAVLGVDSVGVHRDFFAIGGDSVLATSVIARVRDWLETSDAVVADLFAGRTVAGLAERLTRREAQRGVLGRLAAVAAIYLEVAAMTDAEVLADG